MSAKSKHATFCGCAPIRLPPANNSSKASNCWTVPRPSEEPLPRPLAPAPTLLSPAAVPRLSEAVAVDREEEAMLRRVERVSPPVTAGPAAAAVGSVSLGILKGPAPFKGACPLARSLAFSAGDVRSMPVPFAFSDSCGHNLPWSVLPQLA